MSSDDPEGSAHFRPTVAVVTYPFSDPVGSSALENLLRILAPNCARLVAITGNMAKSNSAATWVSMSPSKVKRTPLGLLASRVSDSVQLAARVATLGRDVDAVIFFIGARVHPLAVAAARATRKRCLVASTGSAARTTAALYGATFGGFWAKLLSATAEISERLSFLLADMIGVESESVIKFLRLDSMKKKIQVASEYFVDDTWFSLHTLPSRRPRRIGYIGRLSPEKGVMNFLDSIEIMLPKVPEYEFVLAGSGPLLDIVLDRAKTIGPRLRVLGWVPRQRVAAELAEMRLLVMPSYTEGLPSVAIEAMASGTPILATPVGGIPDMVSHERTGFILADNHPETIATQVIHAVTSERLDQVALASSNFVKEQFSFTKVSERWKECLEGLCG